MKLMMKKWMMRPLTLMFALLLTVMVPFTALAEETGTDGTAQTVAEGTSESGTEVTEETEAPETEAPVVTAKEALKDYTLAVAKTDYVWTGSAIKPAVKLVSSKTSAKAPTCTFKTTYKNNTNIGKATVTSVISVEGCEGTVTKSTTFNIIPPKASGVKITKASTSAITASCKAMAKQTGITWVYKFELWSYNTKTAKWEVTKTVNSSSNKANFAKLDSARGYRVTVTYIAKTSTKSYKGAASNKVSKATAPATTKVSAVKTGAKSMKVTWKKVTRATGYIVEVSSHSNFSNKKTVKVEGGAKTSCKISSLGSNSAYFVRVCAYRTSDNVTTKGTYSDTAFSKPEKASKPGTAARTTSTLTVKCSASKTNKCVYQFRIQKYDDSKKAWVNVKTVLTSKTQYTFGNLNAGRRYRIMVRYARKAVKGGKFYYGEWSKVNYAVTTPAQVTLSNVVKTSSSRAKVTWVANNYGSGYEVQYAGSAKVSSGKKVTVKKCSSSSKSVSTSADVVYARVRAYVVLNGKKIYGAWSTKQSSSWGCVYASYSTYYSSSNYNRTCNLKLACKEINGTILQPGETFSFNNVVGPRTTARGYKNAIVYSGGQEILGVGGGICQVCSTLFNAALKANFTILERHQHSMTVHYVPLGYDAAMAGTAKTLRFTNNSGVPIKISAVCEGGVLTMKLLCNTYKKAPNVTTRVTVSNRVYTLRRYVNGVCNYVTTSKYSDI